jgi:hypothetical protein
VADHEAVELTVDSRRWQMVLDCLGEEQPLCSQKALYDFRMRLMHTGLDRRLLERSVEVARERVISDNHNSRVTTNRIPGFRAL